MLTQRSRKDFTLHVRLTRRCNADCDYCSSRKADGKRMTAEEYRASLEFIASLLSRSPLCVGKDWTLTIQYVGGEILTLPQSELYAIVEIGRAVMEPIFGAVIDGAQSNLIAPPDKAVFLNTLFGERISTSVDPYTDQRKLNGSPSRYAQTVKISLDALKRRRNTVPPGIFVVDEKGLPFVEQVIDDAAKAGQNLRLRPVFDGGSAVSHADPVKMAETFGRAARKWLMNSPYAIEPFREMAFARINCVAPDGQHSHACPFAEDCAGHSLNLDANGDLYLCLDMADADQLKLGNALDQTFSLDRYTEIASRKNRLDESCRRCEWVESCRGGCPSEGYANAGHIGGKTALCSVWQAIYTAIDEAISTHGPQAFRAWLQSM